MISRNPWLIAGGCLSLIASLVHLAAIVGGPAWYRFFGAGEGIARAAERGEWIPGILTLAISGILAIWAAYAFAGAGLIRPLPLMRIGSIVISAIYLVPGLVVFKPTALGRPDLSPQFMLWSSLIVLAFGIVYAVGTWRAWAYLSEGNAV